VPELAVSAFIGELLRVELERAELERAEVEKDELDPAPPTLMLLKVVCA